MDKRISVILITYNREYLLRKNFSKIYSLLGEDDELIIINNNSKDNTDNFLKSIHHPNVRKIFVARQGLNICRNIALKEAKFNNVAFIDDDAYPDTEWLESFRKELKDSQRIAIYAGKTINDFETSKPRYLSDKYGYLFGEKDYGEEIFLLNKNQSPGGGNMIVDKAIIQGLGGFDENFDRKGTSLLSNGEIELVNKIFANNFIILYVPKAKIYHWASVDRLKVSWLIKRMYWQGISDGFLAQKRNIFLTLCMRRFAMHLLIMPIEIILNIIRPQTLAFSVILEITKTCGILKSLMLNIENV